MRNQFHGFLYSIYALVSVHPFYVMFIYGSPVCNSNFRSFSLLLLALVAVIVAAALSVSILPGRRPLFFFLFPLSFSIENMIVVQKLGCCVAATFALFNTCSKAIRRTKAKVAVVNKIMHSTPLLKRKFMFILC